MENTNSLGLLLSFARPCRRLLAASVGLAVLGVASGMVPYFAVSYMIVALYAGTATPGSLFLFALIALLGQAGRVALGTASTVLSHRAAFAILKGIRTDIAAKKPPPASSRRSSWTRWKRWRCPSRTSSPN